MSEVSPETVMTPGFGETPRGGTGKQVYTYSYGLSVGAGAGASYTTVSPEAERPRPVRRPEDTERQVVRKKIATEN